jgi:hypothetical protein
MALRAPLVCIACGARWETLLREPAQPCADCGWVHDWVQESCPDLAGSTNSDSLLRAQERNVARQGREQLSGRRDVAWVPLAPNWRSVKMSCYHYVESAGRVGEDRVFAALVDGDLVLAVIDGAGGSGAATTAADASLDALREVCLSPNPPRGARAWCSWLEALDDELLLGGSGGEAAIVVLTMGLAGIHGASVGDCRAYLRRAVGWVELTAGQHRKPLLGSGSAHPAPIESTVWDERVMVFSDGIANYRSSGAMEVAFHAPLVSVPALLVAHSRLASGVLHDDVAVVVAEPLAIAP